MKHIVQSLTLPEINQEIAKFDHLIELQLKKMVDDESTRGVDEFELGIYINLQSTYKVLQNLFNAKSSADLLQFKKEIDSCLKQLDTLIKSLKIDYKVDKNSEEAMKLDSLHLEMSSRALTCYNDVKNKVAPTILPAPKRLDTTIETSYSAKIKLERSVVDSDKQVKDKVNALSHVSKHKPDTRNIKPAPDRIRAPQIPKSASLPQDPEDAVMLSQGEHPAHSILHDSVPPPDDGGFMASISDIAKKTLASLLISKPPEMAATQLPKKTEDFSIENKLDKFLGKLEALKKSRGEALIVDRKRDRSSLGEINQSALAIQKMTHKLADLKKELAEISESMKDQSSQPAHKENMKKYIEMSQNIKHASEEIEGLSKSMITTPESRRSSLIVVVPIIPNDPARRSRGS